MISTSIYIDYIEVKITLFLFEVEKLNKKDMAEKISGIVVSRESERKSLTTNLMKMSKQTVGMLYVHLLQVEYEYGNKGV